MYQRLVSLLDDESGAEDSNDDCRTCNESAATLLLGGGSGLCAVGVVVGNDGGDGRCQSEAESQGHEAKCLLIHAYVCFEICFHVAG